MHLIQENVVILSLDQREIAVLLVYLEGKINNRLVILFICKMIPFLVLDCLDKMVVMASMEQEERPDTKDHQEEK